MRFGPVPLDEAEGAVLAHSQRLPGGMLRKGSILDAAAIVRLRSAGQDSVIAAQLDPGDVGEEDAARRLGAALAGPGLRAKPPVHGRVNLAAEQAGMLRLDAARLDALNEVDESLTLGTLADYAVVAPETIVATLKVIPFAAPGDAIARVETLAREAPVLAVHAFQPLRVGLVMTRLPGLKESILTATAEATAARVHALTGTLLPPLTCAHETEAIQDALRALIADGAEVLLVAGASAVVDRRDVGPAGIVAAGGRIERFGMPVDPGNLICVGAIGNRPALVLPGCARSPALNGIDFVLNRVFAGLPVDRVAVARMGVGGLLKDIGVRPEPRSRAGRRPAAPRQVAAVVLAAGRSSRMAPRNKLLLPGADGTPMVARVVDAALASRARPVLVVVGNQAAEVRRVLAGRSVRFVDAPDYANGLSASLRAGIAAVPQEAAGALVCLGDMPLVAPEILDALIVTHDAEEGRGIVVPTWRGRPGNPVLWDRRFFPELTALAGDVGGRGLLERHAEQVAQVEVESDAVLRDFDTVESLADLPDALRPAPEHLAAER